MLVQDSRVGFPAAYGLLNLLNICSSKMLVCLSEPMGVLEHHLGGGHPDNNSSNNSKPSPGSPQPFTALSAHPTLPLLLPIMGRQQEQKHLPARQSRVLEELAALKSSIPDEGKLFSCSL